MSQDTQEPVKDKKEDTPAPEPAQPVVPAKDVTPAKEPAEDTAPAPATEVKSEPAPAAPAQPAAPATGSKAGSLVLDILLVLMVVGVIGAGGYYLWLEQQKYHVPSPMERMMTDNISLHEEIEKLQEDYKKADEQMTMREAIAARRSQLADISARAAEKRAAIQELRSSALAIQHEIRSTDKEYRGVARNLLTGMYVGNVTTTNGKTYERAFITHMDRDRSGQERVQISTPTGMSRFPLALLVRDTLPILARYALGDVDLVDMSDFEGAGSAPAPSAAKKPEKSRVVTQDEIQAFIYPSYDPEDRGPVVDTDANATSTTGTPETTPTHQDAPEDDLWVAPQGDLPF